MPLLGVEFGGACYHVVTRGNDGRDLRGRDRVMHDDAFGNAELQPGT
jgi:hypothetical protein